MARTKRQKPSWKFFRRPHHLNEEAQLRQLLVDSWVEGYNISGMNRVHKRLANLPDAWDDVHVSSMWDKYAS